MTNQNNTNRTPAATCTDAQRSEKLFVLKNALAEEIEKYQNIRYTVLLAGMRLDRIRQNKTTKPRTLGFNEQIEYTKLLCDEIEKTEIPFMRTHERMSRKQFNSFLCDLYGFEIANDIVADDIWETDEFFVEIFKIPSSGILIAAHHSIADFNYQTVDVIRLERDAPEVDDDEVVFVDMGGTQPPDPQFQTWDKSADAFISFQKK